MGLTHSDQFSHSKNYMCQAHVGPSVSGHLYFESESVKLVAAPSVIQPHLHSMTKMEAGNDLPFTFIYREMFQIKRLILARASTVFRRSYMADPFSHIGRPVPL